MRILLSPPILFRAISQKSDERSIPTAVHPNFWAATVVEPIPLKGSITLELGLENVLISFSHKETGYDALN